MYSNLYFVHLYTSFNVLEGFFFVWLFVCLLAFGFVLNFILSIQATKRNKQKKGEKEPANTLFNLNGVSDIDRCGNCVLSCSLKCFIACVS